MMKQNCTLCGKPIRHGIAFPALKARIYDAIAGAGQHGISSKQLADRLYNGVAADGRRRIKSHVVQINAMIAREGLMIVSRGRVYRLVSICQPT